MAGTEYAVSYGAFLDRIGAPSEQKLFGPITHVFERFASSEGLTIPVKWRTYNAKGEVYGRHLVLNYAINLPFDESRMKMPADAVIDTSKPTREDS
jgi:hypothetical protein